MLNYQRHGSGPPLVLQHGFHGGAGDWLPLFATFGRHFDVITPDFPGFAGSGEIEAPDSLAGFADALLGLLDELGIEPHRAARALHGQHGGPADRARAPGAHRAAGALRRHLHRQPAEAIRDVRGNDRTSRATRGRRVRRFHRADLVRRGAKPRRTLRCAGMRAAACAPRLPSGRCGRWPSGT